MGHKNVYNVFPRKPAKVREFSREPDVDVGCLCQSCLTFDIAFYACGCAACIYVLHYVHAVALVVRSRTSDPQHWSETPHGCRKSEPGPPEEQPVL